MSEFIQKIINLTPDRSVISDLNMAYIDATNLYADSDLHKRVGYTQAELYRKLDKDFPELEGWRVEPAMTVICYLFGAIYTILDKGSAGVNTCMPLHSNGKLEKEYCCLAKDYICISFTGRKQRKRRIFFIELHIDPILNSLSDEDLSRIIRGDIEALLNANFKSMVYIGGANLTFTSFKQLYMHLVNM